MLKRCLLFASFFLVFHLYLEMTGFLMHLGNPFLYLLGQILFAGSVYLFGRRLQLFEIRRMTGSDWLVYLGGFVAHLFSLGLTEFITVHSGSLQFIGKVDIYAPIFLSYVSISAPLMEEMLDRGWMAKGVFNNSYIGILISSIIFAQGHQPQDFLSWIPYVLIGLILGYMHKRSDNLTPSILLHMTINTLFLIQPFVSG